MAKMRIPPDGVSPEDFYTLEEWEELLYSDEVNQVIDNLLTSDMSPSTYLIIQMRAQLQEIKNLHRIATDDEQ